MSDHYYRLVPDNYMLTFTDEMLDDIAAIASENAETRLIYSDKLAFADAGQNFESVNCPYCGRDLWGWWGETMSNAYSEELGFQKLQIITPCCSQPSTLHDLVYHFPQGFYHVMIEIHSFESAHITSEYIQAMLHQITGAKWRLIQAHY